MIGTNLAITPKSYFRGLSLDPDAQIYISAANITDTTQQSAVNQLVLDFKSIGVWTKEKALYPVLGGSASSHAVNLKQPGTFNLSFATGWTHSNNGMLPNGATYADTFINSQSNLTGSSNHLSFYSRTTTVGTECEIGAADTNNQYYLQLRSAFNFASGGISSIVSYTTTADGKGFWIGSKRANNDREGYRNSSSEATVTTNDTTSLPNYKLLIGARNNPTTSPAIALYSAKQCAFASIGDGLTDTESVNKTVAVQKYQRALGRAVDMEIQVGTGATRSYYTPFSTLDNYSISGNIYLQSEVISAAIPILGIEMYFSGFTLPYTMTNQEIYLAHVTQSQFDSAPAVDFSDLTLSDLTLVKASFTFTAANNAWVRMNFDTPFQYNGTSNILVIWKNNRGTWSSGGGGTDTHVSTSRSMYKVASAGQPTGNGTLTNSRSNIKFIW